MKAFHDRISLAYNCCLIADTCALVSLGMLGFSYEEKHNERLVAAMIHGGISIPLSLAGHKLFKDTKDLAETTPSISNFELELIDLEPSIPVAQASVEFASNIIDLGSQLNPKDNDTI